ncbi:MAG: hypothetical protein AABX13_05670 [Nanoarchaeota archaeon]
MTENPAVNRDMLRRWLREFHRDNPEFVPSLPKRFYRMKKEELREVYYEMLRKYKVTIEDIVGKRE